MTVASARRPRILICTPEVTELPEGMGNAANYIRAKGGGLGDISAGLIAQLWAHDRFELHVVVPKYDAKILDVAELSSYDLDRLVPLLSEQRVHLVADSAFAYLDEVYADSAQHPRIRRAEAFQRYIVNHLLEALAPDVVHCNDWMTGLVPAAARAKRIPSIFTLHNVFTEYETPEAIDRSGIDVRRFLEHVYFERWPGAPLDTWTRNRIDFTATGIHAASIVNTVSPSFLDEVVRGDFPDVIPPSIRHALREQHAAGRAIGILNAPTPVLDAHGRPFVGPVAPATVLEDKARHKLALQQRLGLVAGTGAPLFFWPSRLYRQKGPDLVLAAAPALIAQTGAQIAVVANGDTEIEQAFRVLGVRHRGHVALAPFDEGLSELGKAGADFVLMPSRYEPCGLPQMECPRYGTLPVVRCTGGLKDTVTPLDLAADTGIGFVFEDLSPGALGAAMRAATDFHRLDAAQRARTLARVMRDASGRFSLERTAEADATVYEQLVGERRTH